MNHFELFNLPVQFSMNEGALDHAYRTVQTQVHPDRFATAGNAQKRLAMQYAARVNEAYRTLKDPLNRAIYLLQLGGIDARAENNTTISSDFFMQQMAWRECIEEAEASAASKNSGASGASKALENLLRELHTDKRARFAKLAPLIDTVNIHQGDQQRSIQAAEIVRELMFIERAMIEAAAQLEKIKS